MDSQTKKILTVSAVVLGIVAVLTLNPLVAIDSSERGVVLTWGSVSDKLMGPGLHFRIPFAQSVEQVAVTPQEIDVLVDVSSQGAITADNQTVGADTKMFYRFEESKLTEMRRNWGVAKVQSLLETAFRESFKEVVGKYTIFQVAEKQAEIRESVSRIMAEKIKDYPVLVTEIRIQNYDWSDAFDLQIAATMERAQQVKQAEQDLLLTEQVAQKAVKNAEAQKKALVTEAEGKKEAARLDAESKALAGEGLRKYNDSIRQTLDIEIALRKLNIEQSLADRWNGIRVPEQVFSPIPFSQGFKN